ATASVFIFATLIWRNARWLNAADARRGELLASEQKALQEAEEANRRKDEFLATVSHEVRTPLTSILAWARLLAAKDLGPDKQKEALETIIRNAKSQAQLIDDLLDVSRIITGKLRLDVCPVPLASIVESVLHSFKPSAEARRICLELRINSYHDQ